MLNTLSRSVRSPLIAIVAALLPSAAFAQATQPAASAPATSTAPAASDNPVVILKTNHGDVTVELLADAAPKTVENFLGLATGNKAFTDIETGDEVKRPFYDGLTFHRIIPGFMIQGGDPKGNGTGGPGYEMKDEIDADALGLDKKPAFNNGVPDRMLGLQSPQQLAQTLQQSAMKKVGIHDQESFTAKRDALEAEMNRLRQEMNKVIQDGGSIKAYNEVLGYEYTPGLPSVAPTRGVLAMANSGPNTQGSQFFINLADTPWLAGKHTVFGKVIDGMEVVDAIAKVPTGPGNAPNEPVVINSVEVKSAPATQAE